MRIKQKIVDDKEIEKLKIAINRKDTEKFYMLTALIKAQNVMKKAKITYKS